MIFQHLQGVPGYLVSLASSIPTKDLLFLLQCETLHRSCILVAGRGTHILYTSNTIFLSSLFFRKALDFPGSFLKEMQQQIEPETLRNGLTQCFLPYRESCTLSSCMCSKFLSQLAEYACDLCFMVHFR